MSNQADKIDTLQRILDAAERLFAQHGFHGTSTRQIAAEAGISIQTLHYHCENKPNLYHMVLKRSVIPVTRMIDHHVQLMLAQNLSDDSVLREYTDRIIDELFNVLSENPDYALLFLRQWLEQDTELRKVEQEELMPSISEWVKQVEANVNGERRYGIDLPLVLLSLSWIYWGLNVSPQFIGSLLRFDPESPEYRHRLKEHAKNITERILGTRVSNTQRKRGKLK
jgi:AcrR family transcriptional regulator